MLHRSTRSARWFSSFCRFVRVTHTFTPHCTRRLRTVFTYVDCGLLPAHVAIAVLVVAVAPAVRLPFTARCRGSTVLLDAHCLRLTPVRPAGSTPLRYIVIYRALFAGYCCLTPFTVAAHAHAHGCRAAFAFYGLWLLLDTHALPPPRLLQVVVARHLVTAGYTLPVACTTPRHTFAGCRLYRGSRLLRMPCVAYCYLHAQFTARCYLHAHDTRICYAVYTVTGLPRCVRRPLPGWITVLVYGCAHVLAVYRTVATHGYAVLRFCGYRSLPHFGSCGCGLVAFSLRSVTVCVTYVTHRGSVYAYRTLPTRTRLVAGSHFAVTHTTRLPFAVPVRLCRFPATRVLYLCGYAFWFWFLPQHLRLRTRYHAAYTYCGYLYYLVLRLPCWFADCGCLLFTHARSTRSCLPVGSAALHLRLLPHAPLRLLPHTPLRFRSSHVRGSRTLVVRLHGYLLRVLTFTRSRAIRLPVTTRCRTRSYLTVTGSVPGWLLRHCRIPGWLRTFCSILCDTAPRTHVGCSAALRTYGSYVTRAAYGYRATTVIPFTGYRGSVGSAAVTTFTQLRLVLRLPVPAFAVYAVAHLYVHVYTHALRTTGSHYIPTCVMPHTRLPLGLPAFTFCRSAFWFYIRLPFRSHTLPVTGSILPCLCGSSRSYYTHYLPVAYTRYRCLRVFYCYAFTLRLVATVYRSHRCTLRLRAYGLHRFTTGYGCHLHYLCRRFTLPTYAHCGGYGYGYLAAVLRLHTPFTHSRLYLRCGLLVGCPPQRIYVHVLVYACTPRFLRSLYCGLPIRLTAYTTTYITAVTHLRIAVGCLYRGYLPIYVLLVRLTFTRFGSLPAFTVATFTARLRLHTRLLCLYTRYTRFYVVPHRYGYTHVWVGLLVVLCCSFTFTTRFRCLVLP